MSSVDCQGCQQPITDQFIFKVHPDMQWHEHCLKCAECNTLLTDTCFIRNSRPYCRHDYTKLFNHISHPIPHNCDKCNLSLNRHDLIIKSKDRTFHLDCFKCSICARKLSPGDEYSHQPELNDLLLCKHDALNSQHSPTPKLFLNTITNRYNQSSTMSLTPETSCSLSPSTTSSSSSSSSSVTDSPCANSYISSGYTPINGFHSGPRVAAGGSGPGHNNFGYNSINAIHDHRKDDSDDDSDDDSEADDSANEDDEDNLIDDDNDETLTDDDNSFNMKPKKQKHHNHHLKAGFKSTASKHASAKGYSSSPDSLLMQIHGSNGQYGGLHSSGTGQHSNKPARIRTVLNEKQLHTLRTCYSANPRPDALMKEQLVEMTGLNPRVIRVWFQNKRCKDKKKNMLRPEGHGCHMMGGGGGQQQAVHGQYQGPGTNHHLMYDHCF